MASIASGAKPPLTIEIGPMMEHVWTGIPVFTRRLVTALQKHGGLDLSFMYGGLRIPAPVVDAAVNLGSGSFMRADFEARSFDDYSLVRGDAPIIYPSVKGPASGLIDYESSTVHDISTLVMPEYHEEANVAYHLDHMALELGTNDVTFTISQATDAALRAAFPSQTGKTRLLYQYVDWPAAFELMEHNATPIQLGRYAVVVGTLEPRKNLELLIEALHYPELSASPLKLVVIGKRGWLVDEFMAGIPDSLRSKLIFTGFVTEFAKYRLIKNSEFLIFPSIYEGFGIPALEAMSLGKPVLGSMTSSFPEVIGDGGIFFDPFSAIDFAQKFAVMADRATIRELAPKAIAHAATFGPERMAAPVAEWALEH